MLISPSNQLAPGGQGPSLTLHPIDSSGAGGTRDVRRAQQIGPEGMSECERDCLSGSEANSPLGWNGAP